MAKLGTFTRKVQAIDSTLQKLHEQVEALNDIYDELPEEDLQELDELIEGDSADGVWRPVAVQLIRLWEKVDDVDVVFRQIRWGVGVQ